MEKLLWGTMVAASINKMHMNNAKIEKNFMMFYSNIIWTYLTFRYKNSNHDSQFLNAEVNLKTEIIFYVCVCVVIFTLNIIAFF